MFLLRTRAPHRFGPPQSRPDEALHAEATRYDLADAIERLEYDAEREEREMISVAEEFGLGDSREDDFRGDVSSSSSTSAGCGAGYPDDAGAPNTEH